MVSELLYLLWSCLICHSRGFTFANIATVSKQSNLLYIVGNLHNKHTPSGVLCVLSVSHIREMPLIQTCTQSPPWLFNSKQSFISAKCEQRNRGHAVPIPMTLP